MLLAPTPLAPVKATTVSDWFTAPASDCVLETDTLLRAAAAVAVQISATPRDTAARATRVQVNPAPDTVRNWLFVPVVGPSDAASATSTVAPVVLNGAVVRAPAPSEKTVASTAGPDTAGPLDTTRATALPAATLAPAAGFSLITWPAGTVALLVLEIAPTVSPAPVIAVCAAVCASPTTFGTDTAAGGVPAVNSTTAMFHWSAVGAVTLSVTVLPADAVVPLADWTQNVSPTAVSTNSCTFVWPAGIVRATARSQSLPTP